MVEGNRDLDQPLEEAARGPSHFGVRSQNTRLRPLTITKLRPDPRKNRNWYHAGQAMLLPKAIRRRAALQTQDEGGETRLPTVGDRCLVLKA